MKISARVFDVLTLIAIFFVLFTVGVHIGTDKAHNEREQILVTVKPDKFKGEISVGAEALIDGKYASSVLYTDGEYITLVCDAVLYDAGYLISGAKYVARNQPVKASLDRGYFEGRVFEISRYRV